METIPKQDCQKIGYTQKPHGIQGEVVLIFEPEFAVSIEEEPTLFLEIDSLLVPYFLKPEGIRFRSDDSALLDFDWINDEEEAKLICGFSVYISKNDIMEDDDEASMHTLIGYTLFDSNLGLIGSIEAIDDYAGNLILQLHYKGQEVLIPFNEDFLVRFDKDKQEIELNCPEGILNIN